MKSKILKIKQEHYGVLKDLTDKQAGEFIKGVCAYAFEGKPFLTKDDYLRGLFLYIKREVDMSALNSINGKKGAETLAEKKRKNSVTEDLGMLIGSVLIAADGANKNKVED